MPAARYFTGKPCRNGHLSERWVRTKICIECAKQHTASWYKNHRHEPGVAEGYRLRGKCWREKDPERDRLKAAEWRKLEPEKARAAVVKWGKKNPHIRAANARRRRARVAGAVGNHTATDIADIFKMQKGKCAYCRVSLEGKKYHIDHIQPLSRGGSDNRANIQILCKSCNLSKGGLDPVDFVRRRGGLI